MEKIRTEILNKNELHPRNKNNTRYDFELLIKQYPELKQFVFINKHKRETIDFSNPDAVRALNKVLLLHFYGLSYWDIPNNYLCPPIPGRADYIHYLADLLISSNNNSLPEGKNINVLDIGVGANCIYPIIGHKEYGWNFVGSEVDPIAIKSAKLIIERNNFPKRSIQIRQQNNASNIFNGIVQSEDKFDLTLCNPPFHSSIEQAESGTKRKWKNLKNISETKAVLNFGGKNNELIYSGGEEAFTKKYIHESIEYGKQIFCFSILVSKGSYLPLFLKELTKCNAVAIKTIPMSQGQKKSRILAWTFLTEQEQQSWTDQYWS